MINQKKRQKNKGTSGITLIALVITVIVLLLLAGVSIAMIVDENGIINMSVKTKEETEIASEEEQRRFAMAEAKMNLKNTEYQGVTIPAGFAPTRINGESTIDEGLVIIDSTGNEFVWIPCDDIQKFIDAKSLSSDPEKNWPSWAYLDNALGMEEKCRYLKKADLSNPEEQLEKAYKSIEKYKGFYIGRYEAGVPNNASFYVPSKSGVNEKEYKYKVGDDIIRNVDNLIPVSQKGKQVWNFIDQPHAKAVSEKMYSSNDYVDSYLVDSVAWNYICENILSKIVGSQGLRDSSSWGNYNNHQWQGQVKNSLYAVHQHGEKWTYSNNYNYGDLKVDNSKGAVELATGSLEEFKIFNIYDLAGNVWEWTTEIGKCTCQEHIDSPLEYAIIRGGGFSTNGKDSCMMICDGDNVKDYCEVEIGFRQVLYLNIE